MAMSEALVSWAGRGAGPELVDEFEPWAGSEVRRVLGNDRSHSSPGRLLGEVSVPSSPGGRGAGGARHVESTPFESWTGLGLAWAETEE